MSSEDSKKHVKLDLSADERFRYSQLAIYWREKITPSLLGAFIQFIEESLRIWGIKAKVNTEVAKIFLAWWLATGKFFCLCKNRFCPCEDLIERKQCVCGLFKTKGDEK